MMGSVLLWTIRCRVVDYLLQLVDSKLHTIKVGQALRRLDDVPDLPPIQVILGELLVLAVRDVDAAKDFGAEVAPDGVARGLRQVCVADCDVDVRLQIVIEGGDAVGGEEENAGVVFESMQEVEDFGAAVILVPKELVGLVNEEDGTPGLEARALARLAM